MDAVFESLEIDIFGDDLYGSGRETWAGAAVGLVVEFKLVSGSANRIGYVTHSFNNKTTIGLPFFDGALWGGTNVTIHSLTPQGTWTTLIRDLRADFVANFSEDFDTEVIGMQLGLCGRVSTSQLSNNRFRGQFDNIKLTP